MDPSRSGAVLARHAGIDEKTGQLTGDEDGGPRRLVISSDFYKVYESAGKKADGLVNLYCWAHLRRHVVRAGDANPGQLKHWTDAWLGRIRDLYAAHDELMAAWQETTAPAAREKRPPPPGWRRHTRLGRRDHGDRRRAQEADARPRPAGTGEEGARHPGPRMGRAHRAPRLPDGVAGQ